MSTLANQLAAAEREQVARAIRLLLARPLLTEATDPAGFELVRRRREPLAQWFDYTCGWSLVVEPRRGYARLTKVRADPDGSRPARRARSSRAPFDRRRYVLLCMTAAELLSMPMTTIGMLADRVVQATSADRALAPFDPVHKPERMAFVDVLKLLESYDVLRAVDGTTEAYVESAEAKVLYRVDTTLLMRLPAAPVGASRLAVPPDEVPARFAELLTGLVRERRYGGAVADGTTDEAHGERAATDAQRNLRLRHSVLRRLFDDPVLYRTDLTDDELAYVTSLTGRQILRRSVEQAGLLLEERAEGFLLVDPDGLATDVRFPDDTSTARVAALLLLEPLCAAPAGLLPEQLAEAGADLLRRFPRWARAYQSEDGAARLSDDAVRVLRDVGLARRAGDRVVALLSRALPPLGEGEIAELAEGFARLDRQREHLKRLDDEVTAAETVASRQRAYARRVLRASSAALISATTEMDNLTRVARQSAEELEQALAERESAQGRREEQELRAYALEETVEGLRESDAYQQGEELDRLRRRTEDVAAAAERQRAAAQTAQARSEEDQRHADEAADQARTLGEHAREAAGEAHRAARAAGLESIHHEVRAVLDAERAPALPHMTGRDQGGGPRTTGENGARQARRLLRGADTARRQQVTLVTEAIDEHDRAVRDRGAAEELLDEARTRLAEAIARRDETSAGWDDALAAQVERLLAWAEDCTELRITDLDELAAAAAAEAEVTALAEAAARPLEQEIATAEATTRAARQGLRDERSLLEEKLRRLSGETDLPPVPPPTRTAVRTATAGAPLWRVVAFREGVPLPVQSAVEAALEASGLLDAWVSPYDGLTLPGHDTRAEAALAATAPGPSLLEVLRPEEDIPVPADTVTRILAGIAYGPTLPGGHPAAVSADGAWRLALATGTWSKPEPAHIGALARQRARQRMIGELTDRIGETNASLAALDDRLRGLAARRARLDADRAARPDHREPDARRRDRDRAEDTVAARDDAVRDVAGRLARCEREVAGALRTLDRRAAEHGLPTDRARLRTLSDAIDRFRDTADSWVDARLAATAAADRARQRAAQADRSRRTAEERAEDAAAAEAEATGLKARLEAVEATVGADYRQIVARVAEARTELRRCREEAGRAAELLLRLEGQVGELRATSGQDAERREQAVTARDAAAHRFRHLCLAGLAEDAGITTALDAGDGTKATLEAARATAAKWPDIPHAPRNLGDAATRLSEAVHEARRHLGTRADLDLEPDDDIQLFTATLDGVRVGATGLLTTLTQERDRSRDDITAAERRLFDQILTGDIRRHLAARIRQAGELVDRMNGHLERVRTASNVAVQLVWDVRPDLPDSTRTARQLLLKDPGRVTESDREALHVFFRARIEEAKGSETAASWEEQLGEVLDYTAWHRFTVRLDRANGLGWQPLTKKLHGALSGGEKAIALHLPLFAAVAAHYEAVPLAPRPILLDEVFVGVDTVNRGQVFALLTALDLDLMVTSDHEWCTYGELPGIAVHQLLADGDDDAVTSARFVWNGVDLEAG